MADGQAKTDRLQVTIAVETLEYLRVLAATGLYGNAIPGVARQLLEQGIRDAIASGFIKPRNDG